MANQNAPAGARVVGHIYGADHSGTMRQYVMPATDTDNIFLGDFLAKDTSGGEVDSRGRDLPYVVKAGVGDAVIGVFGGVLAEPDNLNIIYRKGSTKSTVLVYDDPGILFTIQAANLGALTRADILEQNANIILGAGSEAFGQSGTQIDLSTVGPEATKQLRIIEIANAEDNEFGDYVKLLCKINAHQRTWNQVGIS